MAATTMEPEVEEKEEEQQYNDALVDGDVGDHGAVARWGVRRRVSRLAVEGSRADDKAGCGQGDYHGIGGRGSRSFEKREHGRRSGGGVGPTLPPPHAWLAIEDTTKKSYVDSDPEEQWARLLGGGGGAGAGRDQQRRSSCSVVRHERAAREVSLDRAWEMKRSWHQRNGGVPDADTPVVVMVGKASGGHGHSSPSSPSYHQAGAGGGGGVAMDMEEVRACRDLGLELPPDCTVEIQCYGISGGSSPAHTAGSSGTDSPGSISSPGADPTDVKARLKVWAQAVALASTTHLGS